VVGSPPSKTQHRTSGQPNSAGPTSDRSMVTETCKARVTTRRQGCATALLPHTLAGVENVVAVEVALTDGGKRYFLTWGRIQDVIDPAPLCDVVLRFAASCSLGGMPATARLCHMLRKAADSPQAPYFYECFAAIASRPIPVGEA
jgi:hypothetical protein